jgi:hypothetical protein
VGLLYFLRLDITIMPRGAPTDMNKVAVYLDGSQAASRTQANPLR